MAHAVSFNPQLACDGCGRFGAYAFEDAALCTDCYASRGSCCSESEQDDEPTCSRSGAPLEPNGRARPQDNHQPTSVTPAA